MEKTEKFRVEGMSCDGCANTVQRALEQTDGVVNAQVDHEKDSAEITHRLTDNEIASVVQGAGYRVSGKEKS